MMHIGNEKATILQKFVIECLQEKNKNKNKFDDQPKTTTDNDDNNQLVFLELGTYCGYSSIFFVKTILDYFDNNCTNSMKKKINTQATTTNSISNSILLRSSNRMQRLPKN